MWAHALRLDALGGQLTVLAHHSFAVNEALSELESTIIKPPPHCHKHAWACVSAALGAQVAFHSPRAGIQLSVSSVK